VKSQPKTKIHPDLHQKKQKTPFNPQKPTKPRFSPLNFPSKTVIFFNFSQKSRKSSQKVKKRQIFQAPKTQISRNHTQKSINIMNFSHKNLLPTAWGWGWLGVCVGGDWDRRYVKSGIIFGLIYELRALLFLAYFLFWGGLKIWGLTCSLTSLLTPNLFDQKLLNYIFIKKPD